MYRNSEPDQSTWWGWAHSFVYVPTQADIVARSQADINKAGREIDRAIRNSQREEVKQKNRLKKVARESKDIGELKSIAQLIANERRSRIAYNRQKLMFAKALSMLMDVKVKAHMALVINNVTYVMSALNKAMSLPRMMKMQKRFEMASMQFDMKEEICAQLLLGEDYEEEEVESESMVAQILDDIGIERSAKMPSVPTSNPQECTQEENRILEEMERELEALRK